MNAASHDTALTRRKMRVCESSGLHLLDGALGVLQCRTWARYDGGDHLIIVGEVAGAVKLSDKKPLIFAASRYDLYKGVLPFLLLYLAILMLLTYLPAITLAPVAFMRS